jgi:hypothetical protein
MDKMKRKDVGEYQEEEKELNLDEIEKNKPKGLCKIYT